MAHATGIKYLKEKSLPLMWCPGCGNGIVLGALVRAFEELGLKKHETVVVTGIGCWGKADDYLLTNALHTTHGRALAFATGIKAYQPGLNVVVLMGDGDGVTIGGNHFLHAARRNIDLTAVVVNNYNYGMTGGQVSGTTPAEHYTTTTVYGNPERELDPCAVAAAAGANYVARGTAYHGWELKEMIKEAITKKGFSLVEVASPCPTHYGRYNEMKTALAMLRWLKEKAVPLKTYEQLEEPEKEGCFPVGRLVSRDAPDFNARYEKIRARAKKEVGAG